MPSDEMFDMQNEIPSGIPNNEPCDIDIPNHVPINETYGMQSLKSSDITINFPSAVTSDAPYDIPS